MRVQKMMVGFCVWGALAGSALRAEPVSIESRIRQVIQSHEASHDYHDWMESGSTPADLFREIRRTRAASPDALCRSLRELAIDDLTLFEDEVTKAENLALLPCSKELKDKLSRYWTEASLELSLQRASQGRSFLFADRTLQGASPILSMEMHVDASAGPTFVRADLKEGQIALTLDDGPHGSITPRILETLRAYGVRVTFFSVGQMAGQNPRILQAEVADGHTVGSHSWSHPELPKLSPSDARAEITKGREAVAEACGVRTPFFRFPYGSRNTDLKSFVKSEGLASFLWNMDPEDWKKKTPEQLYRDVIAQIDQEKGGILLMHDVQERTVVTLPHILDELRARGYTAVVFVPH